MGKCHEAVIRGAELLDDITPDWYKRIDTEELEISACYACVLGQVYGSYLSGIDSVFGLTLTIGRFDENDEGLNVAIQHGFEAPSAATENYSRRSETEYNILNHHWQKQIEKRIVNDGTIYEEGR